MKHLKAYEGFTYHTNNNWLSKLYSQDQMAYMQLIPTDILETIEYRLMPITDILDKNGKTYNIDVEYTPPSQIFSGEWGDYLIGIDINKNDRSEFEITDIMTSAIELISEMKEEHGYTFKQFNLEGPARLNLFGDIEDPRVVEIEKRFRNLPNEVLGDKAASPANRNRLKYAYTTKVHLVFGKKYYNKYRDTEL